ncbi:MAG: HAD family hydrolase [Phycisphaeraceae bacterium]
MNRAVFLDRDNTLIQAEGGAVTSPQAVRLIQGAASAVASLRGLGYRIVVVSNQSGVAKGELAEADVDAVNRRIAELVQFNSGASIDRFYYCPFHPEAVVEAYRAEDHPWRKPSPGMLEQAAEDLKLDLKACWLVGDHPRDVAAGRAAGVRTVLLRADAPEGGEAMTPVEDDLESPHFIAGNVVEAVRLIAQRPPGEKLDAAMGGRPDAPGSLEREGAGDAEQPPTEDEGAMDEAVADRPAAPPSQVEETAEDEGNASPSTADFEISDHDEAPPTPRPAAVEEAMDDDSPVSHSSGIPSTTYEEVPSAAVASAAPKKRRKAAASPAPTAAEGDAGSSDASLVDVLRSIQRDLKARRADYGDFSYAKMGASLCQMLALGCVLFGMINVGEQESFVRWMIGGTFSQLLVITLLIVHGQR